MLEKIKGYEREDKGKRKGKRRRSVEMV